MQLFEKYSKQIFIVSYSGISANVKMRIFELVQVSVNMSTVRIVKVNLSDVKQPRSCLIVELTRCEPSLCTPASEQQSQTVNLKIWKCL